mmetsp:Transcript_68463/g.216683  ORF Transcript_68463/g.216683 Transcript_68463/m.216683 type:complete len:331 (+) Transcript_68463:121-1113(+)
MEGLLPARRNSFGLGTDSFDGEGPLREGPILGGLGSSRRESGQARIERMARVARKRLDDSWKAAIDVEQHPLTITLKWARRVAVVTLPTFLVFITGAFSMWAALGNVYGVIRGLPKTHPIFLPKPTDEWRDYARTDSSITGWHRAMESVFQKILKHGAVGDIDSNSLEFEMYGGAMDMISELMMFHVALVVVQYFYGSKHLALAVFQLDALMLTMAFRVKKLDDALGAAVDMLEGAHLRFAMMPLATGGEAAQQALIIQKMQTFILYWKRQNLGLSVGVPGLGVVTLNLSMVSSVVAASALRGIPLVFSAPFAENPIPNPKPYTPVNSRP